MNDESGVPPLDAERIVETLDRHGVVYVLVGGMGARLHGATRMTRDLDLCPVWQLDNLGRVASALRELGARLRDAPPDLVFPPITAQTLREINFGTWRTSAGDLDVLRDIPSGDRHHPNDYERLAVRATTREFLGCTIYVADLGDIIVSKEVADRPKDREALPELRALRAGQLAGAAYPGSIEAAIAEGQAGRSAEPAEGTAPERDYRQEPPGRFLQ